VFSEIYKMLGKNDCVRAILLFLTDAQNNGNLNKINMKKKNTNKRRWFWRIKCYQGEGVVIYEKIHSCNTFAHNDSIDFWM
jgi:hypothetical protein